LKKHSLIALFGVAAVALCLLILYPQQVVAQDKPYFVTYSQDLEEPGNLEIETKTAIGRPDGGHRFGALAVEMEYGLRAWWSTEIYLDGQATGSDSALFTGFRWENRVRPLMRDHVINPVLYVEYENINGADKTLLEVVGHDGATNLAAPNGIARKEHKHEGELKLILSSNVHDWNLSENFIAEKNLGHAPWEFGYAAGVTRRLRASGGIRSCTVCAERLVAGVEGYGGLGDTDVLTMRDTSHYVAPVLGWQLPAAVRASFSIGFGLTSTSLARVYRVGLAYEFSQVGNVFRRREESGR